MTYPRLLMVLLAASLLSGCGRANLAPDDPFQWLEEVEGDEALAWVDQRNRETTGILESVSGFSIVQDRARSIYDSDERIPGPAFMGNYVYNFWQDATHVRGIWRRQGLGDYTTQSPEWEVVLDLDALGEAEGENWVWKGATCLYPDYERCMVHLSRGGADATVDREFDTSTGDFVDGGFVIPEAKSSADWIDENTLMVATDFGEGSVTDSGYPSTVRIWRRGTPLSEAEQVFAGEKEDVGTWPMILHSEGGVVVEGFVRAITFYTSEHWVKADGEFVRLELPPDASLSALIDGQLVAELKSDWEIGGRTLAQGAVVAVDMSAFLAGGGEFDILFEPNERSSVSSVVTTKDRVIISRLVNVQSEVFGHRHGPDGWVEARIDTPALGTVGMGSADDLSDRFFFYYTGFTTPTTLYLADESTVVELRRDPSFFDAEGLVVQQLAATSKDGTSVPYFVVRDPASSGPAPTLLYAYGGFEISMRPGYDPVVGAAWLERGGTYVLANLRGGGEFGPAWHQAGLKENRQRVFDDFTAVAEDLIARDITTPDQLGISGGSNGGLLVGVAFTQRPDLYNAVVCSVPLLDMKRYNKLLAGASWMGEYGDPDIPEEWEFISRYSPYHNVNADTEYPQVFFNTSTRDDRVHPGHARKMVARMQDQGHPVFYWENTEGGHGAAVTNEQRAYRSALQYAYLYRQLFGTDAAG